MAPTKKKRPTEKSLAEKRNAKKLSVRCAREKLKNNPEKYEEEKKKDRERKKAQRKSVAEMTEREKRKVRKQWKAMQKGDLESATQYAGNAVLKKKESLKLLGMASKIDSVSTKVQSALTTKELTESMEFAAEALGEVVDSLDFEKVSTVSKKFEQHFEKIDQYNAKVEEALNFASATPRNEARVKKLLLKIADELGMDIRSQLK